METRVLGSANFLEEHLIFQVYFLMNDYIKMTVHGYHLHTREC